MFEISELICLYKATTTKPILYFYRDVLGNLYGRFLRNLKVIKEQINGSLSDADVIREKMIDDISKTQN